MVLEPSDLFQLLLAWGPGFGGVEEDGFDEHSEYAVCDGGCGVFAA